MGSLQAERWLPGVGRAQTAPLRLVCLPFAGGGAHAFHRVNSRLGREVEALTVQLPGREQRLAEAPFRSVPALLDALDHFVTPVLRRGPFAVWGHSLGAKLAFEWTRALVAQGCAPQVLIVSGCPAPSQPSVRERLTDLDDEAFIHEIWRLEGTPREALENRELMQLVLPFLRADYALSEDYVPASLAALPVPVVAWGGLRDPEATPDEIEAWRAHTSTSFRSRFFSGSHFFFNEDPGRVAEELRTVLSEGSPSGGDHVQQARAETRALVRPGL